MSLRVALVTGANRGIGLEIVRQLARRELTVIMGSRDLLKGTEAAAPFIKEGLSVSVVQLDVGSSDSIRTAVEICREKFGPIDILVNNAAILQDGAEGFQGSILNVPDKIFVSTCETNLLGPLRMIQEVLPTMVQRNYGRIVNISSRAGQLQNMDMGYPAYRLSKAALNVLTRIVAAECKEKNIKVNAASPGWVRTDLGGADAQLTVEQGADTPVWLATLEENGPTGGFFENRNMLPW
ncbi:MAG: SDR family oxidoreductase [Hyphomicrobium sp.]